MIFLETGHPIIEETIRTRLDPETKPEPLDITCSDFDDVKYHIVATSSNKNVLSFRMAMPCYSSLASMGATAALDSKYGRYQSREKVDGYDLVFEIDVNESSADRDAVAKDFGEIKRNIMAAPFRRCFEALAAGKSSSIKPMVIPFRPNERIVLAPGNDRVMVFFTFHFADVTDRALAKVFLQEMSEAGRKVPQAPAVTFTTEIPGDLAKVREFKPADNLVGYVMFQVFKSHVEGAEKMEKIITLFQGFRAYLHYHIKASKSHLHSRMRNRVELLLKVLKRADPTAGDESTSKKAYRTYNN
ncbi:Actin-related protein 2/3 complex subunit 2 [Hondaea fermentalgiana]|uniref:Arp2/3 complex 34 kDa subunit n=1 Tax=Hondaea fermentalgiana TaxID=2315210 RepID=A0A2R5GEM2_9STRA|nr:Actin-related protein 2/3 complex subunit 2 [Hondaea fermentalgiana]|eukprot:GBG28749.1 Actin-related protein 2/3 complex subunit 2 [Hondaea fermentalgiana]